MSPFFGSRKHAKAEARPSKHAPSYRRDDEAVEYRQEQKAEVTAESDTKAGTTDPRFKPLPRCRRCGTAIGFEQDKCHSCGEELTRL